MRRSFRLLGAWAIILTSVHSCCGARLCPVEEPGTEVAYVVIGGAIVAAAIAAAAND